MLRDEIDFERCMRTRLRDVVHLTMRFRRRVDVSRIASRCAANAVSLPKNIMFSGEKKFQFSPQFSIARFLFLGVVILFRSVYPIPTLAQFTYVLPQQSVAEQSVATFSGVASARRLCLLPSERVCLSVCFMRSADYDVKL